jgi:dihydroneopterin aldolase
VSDELFKVERLTVEIRGLRVYAYHGVRDFERERGQPFVIDVSLVPKRSQAGLTDDLADAVNYSEVCDRVAELAAGGPYALLERLANVIADDLSARYPVSAVRVRIAKPHAPVKHDVAEVAVVVERGSVQTIGGPEAPV